MPLFVSQFAAFRSLKGHVLHCDKRFLAIAIMSSYNYKGKMKSHMQSTVNNNE